MNKAEARKRPPTQGMGRMLGSGVDPADYMKMIARTDAGEDWVNVCEELGDEAHTHAEAEAKVGHALTARRFYLNAQAAYRVGQYGIIEFTDEKLRLYGKLLDSFAKGVRLYDPPLQRVAIPYKRYKMDGWLWLPKDAGADCPVVLYIAGATGFKEEKHFTCEGMVQRGMAVLNMDGPGQGSTLIFNGGALEIEIEKAHSVMIDYLRDCCPQLGKLGLWGESTGGYYVARTAAVDKRVSACVVRGGSYHPMEVLKLGPDWLSKFARLYLNDDLGYVEKELMPKMTLDGLAERIECSLLVAHGDPDILFSLDGVQRLYEEAPSKDKTIKTWKGAGHGAHEVNTECSAFCADWLADRLLTG
jgi:dienelactone hydrolase